MEIKVYYIIKFLVCAVQILIAMQFLDSIIEEYNSNNGKYKVIVFSILFMGLFFWGYNNLIIVIYYYIFLYLYICKDEYKFSKFFWIIHFMTDGFVVQGTIAIIGIRLGYGNWLSFNSDKSYYKALIIFLSVLGQYIVFKIRMIQKNNKLIVEYLNESLMKLFTIIFVLIQLAYCLLIRNNVINMNKVTIYECALSIILLCFNLFFYKLLCFIVNQTEEKYKLEKNIEQLDLQNYYVQLVDKKYNEISSWKHDYKNNVNIIVNLAMENRREELNKYIEECNEEINIVKTIIFTTVFVIDSIITIKYLNAVEQGIYVEVKCSKINQGIISDFDLNIILGNLLDNAIEAALKAENKKIIIKIFEKKNNLVIKINNTTNGKIKCENGVYLTTKNDRTRGFGLLRVRETLKKYNGHMLIEVNNMFENKIIIPYK